MTPINRAAQELEDGLWKTRRHTPGGTLALRQLITAITGRTVPTPSPKDAALLRLAMGVITRCDHCAKRGARMAAQVRVGRERVEKTLELALLASDGPALMCAAEALTLYDHIADGRDRGRNTQRHH